MDTSYFGGNSATPVAWSGRPASPYTGQRIRVTDLGNIEFYWNGTVWLPIGYGAIAQSAVSSSVTGTTSLTTLASLTIPGGIMGANGALRIEFSASWTANTNLKTVTVALGGTSIGIFSRSGATETGARSQITVRNRGAQNSQVVSLPGSTAVIFGVFTGTYPLTLSKDMSQDQALTITGTLASGSDTLTLESYIVEVIPA